MRFKKEANSDLVKTILESDFEKTSAILKGIFIDEYVFVAGVYENKFETEYQLIPKPDGWEVAAQYTPLRNYRGL